MKIVLGILLFLGCISTSFAEHIIGGDIYYNYLGSNKYQVYIVIYRDCASTGAPFDNPLSLGVFTSSNSLYKNIEIDYPGSVRLPLIFENPCVSKPNGICVERATYTKVIDLPPSSGGYTLAYQRCCRGPNITNLKNPEDTGLTLTAFIPGTNTATWGNSSPRFKNYPPLVICNNENLNFDHSATDPDGDVLQYSLIAPNAGASDAEPMPNPPPSPPYNLVQWDNTFSNTVPLGNGSTTTIHPTTGKLFVDASATGLYVVGIRVSEFRNGKLISSTVRDFIFRVINCVIQLEASIAPQTNYCQGFTINFQNTSYGGTNYAWDFGDPSNPNDKSTLYSPSYTYSDTGFYQVRLIVNPGYPCTDTVIQTFGVHEKMELNFTSIDSMCVTGNSVILDGTFTGPAGTRFSWDFGAFGNRSSDTLLDPPPVVFSKAGFIPVTLTAEFLNCKKEKIDSVFLYDHATLDFSIPPGIQCFPYTAHFTNLSTSNAPLSYFWDFGDGTTSTLRNPIHTYNAIDTFDVSVVIIQKTGCRDTLSIKKLELIKVFPTPTAAFSVDPKETDAFNAKFRFYDESIGTDYVTYWFEDTVSSTERNTSHIYYAGGFHTTMQIVQNWYGCLDTAYQTVYVKPEVTIYIPNTFTPDNDDYNNIWRPVAYDAFYWKLAVYNRWGEQVFYSEDMNEGWDGKIKGVNSPIGTYTYTLQYADVFTLLKHEFQGHFNLIR